MKVHYGTYHSVMLLAHRFFELVTFKNKIFTEPVEEFEQRQSIKYELFTSMDSYFIV